jgi:PAS domain S-box-containing protein
VLENQAERVAGNLREVVTRAREVAVSDETAACFQATVPDPLPALPQSLARLLEPEAEGPPFCDRIVLRTSQGRVLASFGLQGSLPPPLFHSFCAGSSRYRLGFAQLDDDIRLGISVPVPGHEEAELILVFTPNLERLLDSRETDFRDSATFALVLEGTGVTICNNEKFQPSHFRPILQGGPGQITETAARPENQRTGRWLGQWTSVGDTPLSLACIVPRRTVLGPYSRELAAISAMLSAVLLGGLLSALWQLVGKHRRTVIRNCELALVERELRERLRNYERDATAHQRLAAAIDTAGEAMAMVDSHACFVYVNRAFENLFGLAAQEVVGRRVAEFAPPDETERLKTFIAGHRDTPWSRRVRCRHCEGDRLLLDLAVSPVRNKGREEIAYYFAIAHSVGNEIGLEERTVQARKIDAVARFAGGMAHEFNNLLQVIIGYAGEMVESVESPDLRESLEQILTASRRGSGITARLIAFSRRQAVRCESDSANTAIRATVPTLQQRLGLDVDLRLDLADPLWPAAIDRGRLGQALVFLAENASADMRHGGVFTVTTSNIEFTETCETLAGPLPPGQYVRISVSDTGQGLTPELLGHLFEPQFEAAQNGQKAFQGLGLSMVHGIIAQHKGGIVVDSVPGRGTSFHIYLPRARDGEEPKEIEQPEPAPAPCRQAKVVLLAEDEESVRQVANRLLSKAGYHVIEGVDGKDALALFEANRDRIDLAMLDLVMPEMNGAEVAEQIRRQAPDLPILFCSGYAHQQFPTEIHMPRDIPLLGKPYEPCALLDAVERLLNAAPSRARRPE